MAGVETVDNRVHDNTIGIFSQHSGLVRDNRVWHNANIGIVMDRATVSGNRVYANSIGIQTSGPYGFGGQILNNLVYANANEGLLISGAQPTSLVANNTIYQPVGDAVRVQGGSNGTRCATTSSTSTPATTSTSHPIARPVSIAITTCCSPAARDRSASGKARALPRGPIGSTNWAPTPTASRVIPSSSIRPAPTASWATRAASTTARTTTSTRSTVRRSSTRAIQPRPINLEPVPNGGRVNIGLDGNTPLANLSPAQLVQVLAPAGLEKFEVGQQVLINWRSFGLAPTDPVDIDLMESGNPDPVASIASGALNNDTFAWIIPGGIPLGNQYQIRVTVAAQQAVSQNFQIVNPGTNYYVNDAGTAGDVFTSAVGDNANSGKSPDAPMASLAALLLAYDIDPGDTIYVDAGTYQLTQNILITAQDSGVTDRGPRWGRGLVEPREHGRFIVCD